MVDLQQPIHEISQKRRNVFAELMLRNGVNDCGLELIVTGAVHEGGFAMEELEDDDAE